MPSISKLPSGKWRALADGGKDETGKRIRKSFTAKTKQEALALAYAYEGNKTKFTSDITIENALNNYIAYSTATLSPSTVAEYKRCAKLRFDLIGHIRLADIQTSDMRALINEWAGQGLSPKTIRNCYNLVHAAIKMYRPDISFLVTMPKKRPTDIYIPSDEEISKLLQEAKGTDIEIPIMLAAYCSMRRGEIAALKREDIRDGLIYISKNMVKNDRGEWVIKSPKTVAGYRRVKPPKKLLEMLEALPPGNIISSDPNTIYKKFKRIREKAGLPSFRFHALRHYYASSLHYAGVPDKYIMEMGGWESATVLQNIYQHTLREHKEEMMDIASKFFEEK